MKTYKIKCTKIEEKTPLFTEGKYYEFKFTGVKDTQGNSPLIILIDDLGNEKFLSYRNGYCDWIINPNEMMGDDYPRAIFREEADNG